MARYLPPVDQNYYLIQRYDPLRIFYIYLNPDSGVVEDGSFSFGPHPSTFPYGQLVQGDH